MVPNVNTLWMVARVDLDLESPASGSEGQDLLIICIAYRQPARRKVDRAVEAQGQGVRNARHAAYRDLERRHLQIPVRRRLDILCVTNSHADIRRGADGNTSAGTERYVGGLGVADEQDSPPKPPLNLETRQGWLGVHVWILPHIEVCFAPRPPATRPPQS